MRRARRRSHRLQESRARRARRPAGRDGGGRPRLPAAIDPGERHRRRPRLRAGDALFGSCRYGGFGRRHHQDWLLPGGDPRRSIAALGGSALGRTRLVGVFLADLAPDMELIEDLAEAGFMGVMLDTAGKTGASLPDLMTAPELRAVHRRAHAAGLPPVSPARCGSSTFPALVALDPDVLGFRGALCRASDRRHAIDAEAVARVRRAIPARLAATGSPLRDVSAMSERKTAARGWTAFSCATTSSTPTSASTPRRRASRRRCA